MENAWKTQWEENHVRRFKRFEGDSPHDAVAFGKKLKSRGIIVVDIISQRRAFPPPIKAQTSPKPGLLWCPYCVKWREFSEIEVQGRDFKTPALLRCTVCTISVKDCYVRTYNPELVMRYEIEAEIKAKRREAAKKKRQERAKMANPFRTHR